MASSETTTPGRLPWRVRFLYGTGDFGLVLPMQLAGILLLFFFTEVLGIEPALAGTLILIGLVFDGITDVLMGVLADKARPALGGYRPWILVGAPLLAIATAVLFMAPAASGWELAAIVIATQFFFRGAFTIVSIPYVSLSSSLTSDSRERSLLVGIRMTFSTLAALTVAIAAQPLVGILGEGDAQRGFFLTAVVFGCGGAAFLLIAWFATRGHETAPLADGASYRLADLPRLVAQNKPFLIVAAAILLHQSSLALVLTGAPYFFEFARGEAESMGLSLAVLIGGVGLFIPVWTVIVRRIGKRPSWLIGAAWSAIALAGLSYYSQAPLPEFLAAMAFSAFGFAALGLTAFSMLPDTVEYGEWKTGTRVEAALTSALTFSQKCAAGLASLVAGLMLSYAGHSQEAPMSGAGAQTFGVLMFAIPSVLIAASILIVAFYPISTRFHDRLVRELAERKG